MARVKGVKKVAPRSSAEAATKPQSPREIECFDEDDVLLPISQPSHPDDWPCFVLQDAVVVDKDGNLANLLNAEIDGPLFVKGYLEEDKKLKHLRKIRDLKDAQVSVSDVNGFSMDVGPITIWALGNTRWFEINPAVKYRKIYERMTQGVELYYFLIDIYETRRPQKNGKGAVTMDHILKEYSDQNGGSVSQDEFVELCMKHALFLFSQMLKAHEPVMWSKTVFFKWLLEQCPDIHNRYLEGMKKNKETAPPEILEILEGLYKSGRHRREKLTLRQLSRAMFETFDFQDIILAQEYIRGNAESLLLALKAGWEGEDWRSTPLYLKLEETVENPGKDVDLQNEVAHIHLKRRVRQNSTAVAPAPQDRAKNNIIEVNTVDDESSSSGSSVASPSSAGRVMKAGKGKGRQNSEDEEMQDVSELSRSPKSEPVTSTTRAVSSTSTPQYRGRVGPSWSGKKAALRLVNTDTVPKSSMVPFVDAEGDDEGRSRKRRRISPSTHGDVHYGDQNSSGSTSHESEDDDEDNDEDNDEDDNEDDSKTEDLVRAQLNFTLDSIPLPSTAPQGSNGLWTCDRRGCNHTVTKADEPEGKSKVHEHLRSHANEIASRENLILKEARGGLKVDHLLEKIRKLGETARLDEQKTINGRVVPLPIQRRMLS